MFMRMKHTTPTVLLLVSLLAFLTSSLSHSAESKQAAARFLMYNVRNYFVDGELNRSPYTVHAKKHSSCEAVVDVIASARPDIIGLTEIGGRKALADLQARLAKRGLHYPHSRVVERAREPRALALLSRYPIIQDQSKAEYGLYGQQRQPMLRGILDLTVKVDEKHRYRILGAHLKARKSNNPSEATSLRRREAETLSRYIASSSTRSQKLPLLVYGDWNDEPHDAALSSLSSIAKLQHLKALDAQGKPWTLYYRPDKKYLIFDQIYINQALRERLPAGARSGVVDHRSFRHASDHRAVWCDLY